MKINSTLWFVLLFLSGILATGFIGAGVVTKYYILFTTGQFAPDWVYLYLSLPGYISLVCFIITALALSPKTYESPTEATLQAMADSERSRLEAEIQLGMTAPVKTLEQTTEDTVAAIQKALNTVKKNQ